MFENMNLTPLALQILTFLARNPDTQFYGREIAKIIDKSVGGTHKNLKNLEHLQYITSILRGKNRYYQINQTHPALPYFKIFSTIHELTPLITSLKKISLKIILFGSCATGNDTSSSDIDILILTTQKEKVRQYIQKKRYIRTIQPVIVTADEQMQMKEKDPAFYQESMKGIVLWEGKYTEI